MPPRRPNPKKVGARPRLGPAPDPSQQAHYSELCRSMVLDLYSPAAVLINATLDCLFFQGPTDRYLKIASGRPSANIVEMAREDVRAALRLAISEAQRTRERLASPQLKLKSEAGDLPFSVIVTPVSNGDEELFLVCFLEQPVLAAASFETGTPRNISSVADIEGDFAATRAELQTAVRALETTATQQAAIYEEAISVNEGYQIKNEELMASRKELQFLNENLNALNTTLQETFERQRTTANDLQNVLDSTDVATIFLDTRFKIRFFTPATKALFNVIPGDVGRPLADLKSLAPDFDLLPDAQSVLDTQTPIEREVVSQSGAWFMRRILPYRTRDKKTEGVVITFVDISERKSIAEALSASKRTAELASIAKSRFLAAASHDLRQPLQTLSLLQGLLASKVTGEKEQKLVGRMEEALGAMTNMLNTLLDINQIEVGAVKVEVVSFSVNDLFGRLRSELTYSAQSQGLALKVMRCGVAIESDPRLLEQMIRNLLSNALKYTQHGRVLLGCRRRSGKLRIEIWDTGVGICASELDAIFEEYHQVDNPARERSRGLGLGLSIVKSLCDLLGHQIQVRSLPGKGSVFSIEVPIATDGRAKVSPPDLNVALMARLPTATPSATILIVEDDPEVREYLALFLSEQGFQAVTAFDGPAALSLLADKDFRPDLVLADYNLPNGLTGVDVSQRIRRELGFTIPFVILTGDISTSALRDIALHDCVQFSKPVKLSELTHAIAKLLSAPHGSALEAHLVFRKTSVFVVDDDALVRGALGAVLGDAGHAVTTFASCEAFLEALRPEENACLLVDAYLPGMSGLQLLQKLRAEGRSLPTIMITGDSDVAIAVAAMKAGAIDFIEKPVGREELIASLDRALELTRDSGKYRERQGTAAAHLVGLTRRQVQVMEMVLAGHPSKNIAADLGISQRTVENHRMRIMKQTGSKSLPALARLALIAAGEHTPP